MNLTPESWQAIQLTIALATTTTLLLLVLATPLAWWLSRYALLNAPAVLVAMVSCGFLAAGLRAHLVQGPMLEWRYYGPVTGRVIDVDRSQSDALRITLDRVQLDRMPPDRTPRRVRVSLHGEQGWLQPVPGQVVIELHKIDKTVATLTVR